jgi:TRAP-type mannitol/chloroaromatic compound transport system substrate-binding protein
MQRRKFLAAGALAAPALLAAPTIARAQAAHDWKLVTSVPKGLPGPGTSAQRWADRVTAMSGGAIKVTVYGAGELVPPFGTQEAVETGNAQVYHRSGSWFSGRGIAHAFFTSAPFGITPDEMHAWMYFGGGQALLDEFTHPRGLQVFIGGGSGVQTAGWFKKPINSLADLQGMNFRITGFGAAIATKLGMNAVSMPAGEIFPALQSGALDGAEWVGPANDMACGFQKIMTHMYTPSFADIYGGIEFGINKAAWDALSDELRMIVQVASEAEATLLTSDSLHSNILGLEKLRAEPNVTVAPLPADVREATRAAARSVMEEVANTNPFVGKLVESYDAYAAKAAAYNALYDEPLFAERAKYFG